MEKKDAMTVVEIVAKTLTIEEKFCFIEVDTPYLCGLWRFANAHFI